MKISLTRVALLSLVLAIGAVAMTSAAMAGNGERMYKVTITNATLGQPIAPSVIATHTGAFHLFDIGPAPGPLDAGYDDYFALAAMAETGYPFHVLDRVLAADGVWDAKALLTANNPPVIFPGGSNSTMIGASGNAKYLTTVAMLGATNDAFYAVRGVKLPRGIGEITRVYAPAYDAGSEANAESSATVGALGAMDDNPVSGTGINDGSGEGYIHVHSGIHGVADLDPAVFDWRNPVVEVTIERVQ